MDGHRCVFFFVGLRTHGAQAYVCRLQSAFTVFWTILNSVRPFYHLWLFRKKLNFLTNSNYNVDVPKIPPRYPKDIYLKIYPRYPQNIPQISHKIPPSPVSIKVTCTLQPVDKVGSSMETTATCGAPTRRTGLMLRSSAWMRAAIWPLSPQMPSTVMSGREYLGISG